MDCHTDYKGKGIDQLNNIIRTLKEKPHDRRMVMSAWNPKDLHLMALPPCHCLAHFYVNDNNELSCHMYQRSCDLGLGVPFNIASYALLTCLVAHVVGLKRGEFVHTLGDAHIYLNHVDALKEQIKRTPNAFPKLVINNKIEGECEIDDFELADLDIVDYKPQATIKLEMAV